MAEFNYSFLVVSQTAVTSPKFSIKDLPGTSGRLDVVCRCLSAALKTPWGIHRAGKFYALLEGKSDSPLLITVDGNKVLNVPKDEFEAAIIIRDILRSFRVKENIKYAGWSVQRKNFRELITELSKDSLIIQLSEKGEKIQTLKKLVTGRKAVFVLGANLDLSPNHIDHLNELNSIKISLGDISYLASQCISLIHINLQKCG
ncbi:MAG: tRNA (pseudouridine(54)-N(1))-methyltransferase TrmY [Candidatus Odinarchaeia archaeon]